MYFHRNNLVGQHSNKNWQKGKLFEIDYKIQFV